MKNNIKLICTDIDGTLITDSGDLPKDFDKVLADLKDKGVIFVAASGRCTESIKAKINSDLDNIYYISTNGAIVEYNNEVLLKKSFTKDKVRKLVNGFRAAEETSIVATTENISYIELYPGHEAPFFKEYYHNYKVVDDINDYDDEIVKVTAYSINKTKENLNLPEIQEFKDTLHFVSGGKNWIDITRKDSNKGNALQFLLDHLNIDAKDTIGFGDYQNDIAMLELVNTAYAMKDAHPDVLKIADQHIGSNNDGCVKEIIVDLFK